MQAAIAKLEADLVELQDDAAEAASEVLFHRNYVMLLSAQTLLAETTALKTKLAINVRMLGEIVRGDERLSFNNMIRGEKARSRREAVFEEIKRGAERLHFSGNIADYAVAEEASAKWRQTLTALQTDALAKLPEV